MVEGLGHVSTNQIVSNIQVQKTLCYVDPFHVLGSIAIDLVPAYDHITSAIVRAITAQSGANFLCYATSAEHLSISNLENVKEETIASKIIAQFADAAKGLPSVWEKEKEMTETRKKFDWNKQFELVFNSEKCEKYRPKLSSRR